MSTKPSLGLANPIISPLDFTDLTDARKHIAAVADLVGALKVGSMVVKALSLSEELPTLIKLVNRLGLSIMWDEKFSDIPFQIGKTVGALCSYTTPKLLTVHANAGPATIKAAVGAAGDDTIVTAISVLTSINPEECAKIYGEERSVGEVVRDLALIAVRAGAGALVCSPQELYYLNEQEAQYPELAHLFKIVPGIRPMDSPPDDQKRKATPYEAGMWGADAIVVGRMISESEDPAMATQRVLEAFRAGQDQI
jgi:orotidine-5'-phosphate decarboxylase